MAYMFDVYTLVTVFVFGLAGSLILALFIANQANEHLRLQQAIRKIVANSRRHSRSNETESSRRA